jgi:hypothetical protein
MDQLAINIGILSLVNELPETPSFIDASQVVEKTASRSERTIRLRHEISLNQHLAFICGYSDDALHVMGTCIEECDNSAGLVFRYAANTGKHDVLRVALKDVARLLQDEANKSITAFCLRMTRTDCDSQPANKLRVFVANHTSTQSQENIVSSSISPRTFIEKI